MQFKFNFHQVDPSQALMRYIEKELDRAAKHLLTEASCQVFCRMGRVECEVQVEVNSPWGHFRATGTDVDFYVAADRAAEKLSKQFKKHKEKHQSHHKPERSKQGKLRRVNPELEYDNSPYGVPVLPHRKVS